MQKYGLPAACIAAILVVIGCNSEENKAENKSNEVSNTAPKVKGSEGQQIAEQLASLLTGTCGEKRYMYDVVGNAAVLVKDDGHVRAEYKAAEVRPVDRLFGVEERGLAITRSSKFTGNVQRVFKQNGDWYLSLDDRDESLQGIKVANLHPIPVGCSTSRID
jgi:hypothetical protein